MFIHSESISIFLKRVKMLAFQIMIKEMGIECYRERFRFKNYRVPLNFVVFEKPRELGFFNSHHYQIGISKKLMFEAKTVVLENILRHELAHLMTFLEFGDKASSHGKEFQSICLRYGWGQEISSAQMDIEKENEKIEGDISQEKIVSKVKKLLSLSSSSNPHEAQLATIKANQLLLKYNLEKLSCMDYSEEEEIFQLQVLEGKRVSEKVKTIYEILPTFFVSPVFNHGKGKFYLEVVGTKVNVEMAKYVAHFLDQYLEDLWTIEKKNQTIKGPGGKSSFMRGIGKGYLEKLKKVESEHLNSHESKGLMILKKDLKRQVEIVYGRLGYRSSKGSIKNKGALEKGKKAGKHLSIRPPIDSKSGVLRLLS